MRGAPLRPLRRPRERFGAFDRYASLGRDRSLLLCLPLPTRDDYYKLRPYALALGDLPPSRPRGLRNVSSSPMARPRDRLTKLLPLRGLDEVVALDGGLSKLEFLDLTARRHRELFDEVHVLGDLVAGYILPAVFLDVSFGKGSIPLQDYGGGDPFAILLVGHAVDLDVGDLR